LVGVGDFVAPTEIDVSVQGAASTVARLAAALALAFTSILALCGCGRLVFGKDDQLYPGAILLIIAIIILLVIAGVIKAKDIDLSGFLDPRNLFGRR
jgi:4-amino-4-deoxy-L-arabinose transferase-like glycosyltransferase